MTLEDVNKLVELFRQNPILGMAALLPWLAIIWRQVRSKAPAPTPGTTWATICAVVDFIAGVIPTAKVDAKPTAAPVRAGIVDFKTGEPLPPDIPRGTLVSVGADGRVMPFKAMEQRRMRRQVRRIAFASGRDISDMDDAGVDEVIERARAKAQETSAGPLRDLLAWIVANPQVILAILSLFMGEKQNEAAEVTV